MPAMRWRRCARSVPAISTSACWIWDLPGLSGFELAQHLRNQGYMLPLMAVTARTDPDLQQQVEAAGIGGFLRKPVTG